MADFKPSEPIGSTDQPDSPVSDDKEGSVQSDLASGATCYYNGRQYRQGAQICRAGEVHECNRRGEWTNLRQRC